MTFRGLRQHHLDEKRRDEEEDRERRKDKQKLKQRKENNIPQELFNQEEPAKKRSKLVLPEPQISDMEMESIVKLGKASEAARESVAGGGEGEEQRPSDTLLADYAVTPGMAMRTPRTPMAAQDKILQEAQNIMALTNVDTPLKGGSNTELVENGGDFGGMTPAQREMKTPNTVLATPYRTKEGQVAMTPGQATPGTGGQAGTPLATPLRDKLAINPSEAFMEGGSTMGKKINFVSLLFFLYVLSTKYFASGGATGGDSKFYQREVKETLKLGLSTLPAPKNDFEIVVPENEEAGGGGEDVEMADDANTWIEDQADLDQQTEEEYRARRERELRRRSQAVQRDLPRPTDMNDSVLRPLNSDPPLTELQRAEELIKREMIVMMHHDCVETPTPAQMGEGGKKKGGGAGGSSNGERAIVNEQLHRAFLEKHPYQQFSEEEVAQAKELLQKEMETVKAGMDHNLSDQAYTQVWEECLAQVRCLNWMLNFLGTLHNNFE